VNTDVLKIKGLNLSGNSGFVVGDDRLAGSG
jgi:hypothetical protein